MPPSNYSVEEDNSASPRDLSPPRADRSEESQTYVEEAKREVELENSGECVSIPIEFAIKNVWPFVPPPSSNVNPAGEASPESTSGAGSYVDHDIVFPPGLMADARARFKISFSDRAQLAALPEADEDKKKKGSLVKIKKRDSQDPVFTLFSPQRELSIIDSFVRQIASSQEADVVVLDSIDLLSGEGSLLGKQLDEVMEKINGSNQVNSSKTLQRRRNQIRHYLRALVALDIPTPLIDIQSKDAPAPSDETTATAVLTPPDGPEDEKIIPRPRNRIIYLRDFGPISSVAAPFLREVLAAIQLHRNCSNQDPTVVDPARLHRVVLVMGVSRPLKTDRDQRRFESGGTHVYKLLPVITSPSSNSNGPIFLRAFSKAYLEEESPPPKRDLAWGEYDDNDMGWSAPTSSERGNPLHGAVLAVFKPDLDLKWWEEWEVEREERLLILNDLIIREAIFAAGGFPERGNALKAIFGMKAPTSTGNELTDKNDSPLSKLPIQFLNDPRQQVLSISLVERLASHACGLAPSATHSSFTSDNSSISSALCSVDAIAASSMCHALVTPEIILEAWNLMDAMITERREFFNVDGSGVIHDTRIQVSKLEEIKRGQDLNTYERQLLSCVVDPTALKTKFEDVCIAQATVDAIHSIITFPLLYPSAYNSGILKSEAMSGILLYGPPGTGKTLLCKAIAKRCNTHMLQITPASAHNMYVGETEKCIKAIFSLARRLGPCIIFIDEVDALFRSRSGSNTGHSAAYRASMLAEFMQEMDGLQSTGTNKEKGIIVIGCTNRPFDLDDAVLRRLPRRLLVDLPEFKEREKIVTTFLREEVLSGVDISEIARRTKHFSGSDLKHLCVAAALASIQEVHATMLTSMNILKNDGHHSINSQRPNLPPRVLTPRHFAIAFGQVSASCSEDLSSVKYLRRWAGTFASNSGAGLVDSESESASDTIKSPSSSEHFSDATSSNF